MDDGGEERVEKEGFRYARQGKDGGGIKMVI